MLQLHQFMLCHLGTPAGSYTVTSSITSTEWTSIPAGYTSSQLTNVIEAGTPEYPEGTTEFILLL
jgi:hypothetical protein